MKNLKILNSAITLLSCNVQNNQEKK